MTRFQEAAVWASGKFRVDSLGRVWKGAKRADRHVGDYLQVTVQYDGRRYYTCAHRLVWHALIGPIPEGHVINHQNGIKDDNRPQNLECVTASENSCHAARCGLRDQRGERNPSAKLKDKQIPAIRMAYFSGDFTQQELADKFGVSFKTISKIVRGERRPVQAGPVGDYSHRRRFEILRDDKGRIVGRVRQMPEGR